MGGLVYAYAVPGNSSTTPLASAATFTGTWTLCEGYSSVTVAALTDQDGSLFVDLSPDGTNADSTLTFSMQAGINEVHRITITRKYYRVRLTNTAAGAQTYLRLQSILGEQGLLSSPLNQAISQDSDAITTRTITQETAIAIGLMTGYSVVNKFGKNSDVDTATVPEDIWEGGGVYTGFPAGAAETISVFSSSASDTAAGAGARTIRISGLDANYNVVQETVTLNGVTPVATVATFIRAHTATVLTSGSSNLALNVGTITIRHTTTTANVFLSMVPGTNQTNCSAYTVPAGFTAYMQKISGAIRGGTTATVDGVIYVKGNTSAARYRRPFTIGINSPLQDAIYGGLSFAEKTDICLRITNASANNLDVTGGYDLILVKN